MEPSPDPQEAASPAERPWREYFSGQLSPPRLSARYRLGLAAVALAMLALPLIYLGLIVLFGWATWFYATHGLNWFFPVTGGTRQVYHPLLLIYLGPLLAGALLVFFMLKPLFARRRLADVSFPISHLEHRELFRFIGQLCLAVGAPIPSRVDVDLTINASAGFRAGFSSLFGNDIKLAFGLPLAAGMSCREFAGILAHELGHFTQRAAMRFGFIITVINHWLGCRVYERDVWDDALEGAMAESALVLFFGLLARVGIGLTRGILWLLMITGHAFSSFLFRQMEFQADACAIGVAGTEGFLAMGRKLLVLGACTDQARLQFEHRIAPKLPDDMSTYIAMLAAQCAGQTQGKVFQAAARRKTRWFHSHPSDAERTARALRANQPGLIHDSRPAVELFGDFSGLSRSLTAFYYAATFGRPLGPEHLFTVQRPSNAPPDTTADEAAIKSYFGGLGSMLAPVLLAPGARLTVGLASARLEQLQQARRLLQETDLTPLRESLKQIDARLLEAAEARALQEAGLETGGAFSLAEPERADLPGLIGRLEQERQQTQQKLGPFLRAGSTRLITALSLLRTPAIAAAIPGTDQLQEEVLDLLHVFGKVSVAFPPLLELRRESALLQALLAFRGQVHSEMLDSAAAAAMGRCNDLLARIQEAFGTAGYPFEHPRGPVTIVEYARAKEYDAEPLHMTFKEAESHLQLLFALYCRVLARLMAIALMVEAQLAAEPGPSRAGA